VRPTGKVVTVGYVRTNVIGSRTSFVLTYIVMYVFRGNPFQAHNLEQSYRLTQPFKQKKIQDNIKNMCKNDIKLIELLYTADN
jgi:hypothetical protein